MSARFILFEKIIDLAYDNFKYIFIPRFDRNATEHQKAKQNLSESNVLFRNIQSLFIFPLMYGLLAVESFTICTLSFVFSFIIEFHLNSNPPGIYEIKDYYCNQHCNQQNVLIDISCN